MPIIVNLRRLTRENQLFEGEITPEALDLPMNDEMIQIKEPLHYDLEVQLLDNNILAQGSLSLNLSCECVRCLKPFLYRIEIEDWAAHLPLEGEDKATIVDDSVDLTPFLREDIVLAFPAHPVCKPDCPGLAAKSPEKKNKGSSQAETGPSAWTELDKLKFRS